MSVNETAAPLTAYLAIKYHENHANRARIEGLTMALQRAGFETTCITRDVERWGEVSTTPRDLMARTFWEIDRCDLAVIELTEKGVGVGIEAGYAHARGKPVVTVAERGADVSMTLEGISSRIIRYDRAEDLAREFQRLRRQLPGDRSS